VAQRNGFQAQAFLLEAQTVARMMPDGGRIIAISYSPSGRTGSWQPWIAMGAAKAAMDALADTLPSPGPARYHRERDQPRSYGRQCGEPPANRSVSAIKTWHENGWTPLGRIGTPRISETAVLLLCMDEAGFITGQTLHVDGGASIMDTVFPLDIQRG